MNEVIPFNQLYLTGKELGYMAQASTQNHLSGDGVFTKQCNSWLEQRVGCHKAMLTHSCTSALEMAALLVGIKPGDEVIMPSYTFVSTANAFVLRGGVPVFVDIRPDTLNLDESKIEAAITPRTKAIVPVHYAGVSCEMDSIMKIAEKYNLFVIEDAAQAILSEYKGRTLGSIGHLATISFHETKNIISGEGGALLVNDRRFTERAQIILEKGTNRSQFLMGTVDKYTWVDAGSSYLPSELIAAFLLAQLEDADDIMEKRMLIWNAYHEAFKDLEEAGLVRRPVIPGDCIHNAHIYYLVLKSSGARSSVLSELKNNGINATFHYVPLHNSPFGKEKGRQIGSLLETTAISERLLRMPLWIGLDPHKGVIAAVKAAIVACR